MKPHKAPLGLYFRLPAKIGNRFPVNPCKYKLCKSIFHIPAQNRVEHFSPYSFNGNNHED